MNKIGLKCIVEGTEIKLTNFAKIRKDLSSSVYKEYTQQKHFSI